MKEKNQKKKKGTRDFGGGGERPTTYLPATADCSKNLYLGWNGEAAITKRRCQYNGKLLH